jgi:aryl-alcohol dehydrogenase-like predicted oxidoreductase
MGRTLGRSGIEVSDVGFGCWAIGGPFTWGGRPDGCGESLSPRIVPIPGTRTVAQAEQNAAPIKLGPLPPSTWPR